MKRSSTYTIDLPPAILTLEFEMSIGDLSLWREWDVTERAWDRAVICSARDCISDNKSCLIVSIMVSQILRSKKAKTNRLVLGETGIEPATSRSPV
jgi:hypothetical protein